MAVENADEGGGRGGLRPPLLTNKLSEEAEDELEIDEGI